MKPHLREEPTIVAAAERRMQEWSRGQEITDRLFADRGHFPTGRRIWPYAVVSREAGTGGGAVAEKVGQMLGWDVLGGQILDRIAQRYHLSRPMLALVDETRSNWVHDVLGTWLDPNVIPHEKFICFLRHVVLIAAHAGPTVFIGRGAQFLLPREMGVAVRLVASESYRVARVAERLSVSEKDARRMVREIDQNRREFVARYFRHDINDPHAYDLVIDVERRGEDSAAEAIVALCRRLGEQETQPSDAASRR